VNEEWVGAFEEERGEGGRLHPSQSLIAGKQKTASQGRQGEQRHNTQKGYHAELQRISSDGEEGERNRNNKTDPRDESYT